MYDFHGRLYFKRKFRKSVFVLRSEITHIIIPEGLLLIYYVSRLNFNLIFYLYMISCATCTATVLYFPVKWFLYGNIKKYQPNDTKLHAQKVKITSKSYLIIFFQWLNIFVAHFQKKRKITNMQFYGKIKRCATVSVKHIGTLYFHRELRINFRTIVCSRSPKSPHTFDMPPRWKL